MRKPLLCLAFAGVLAACSDAGSVDPDAIPTRTAASITPADFDRARRSGGTIRQIAHAEYDDTASTLTVRVAPTLVARGSIFSRTTGPQNAAIISGAHCGEITIAGAGAGGDATAVAILSDVISIARDRAAIVPAPVLHSKFQILNSEFAIAEAV